MPGRNARLGSDDMSVPLPLMEYGRYLFHYTRWDTASEAIIPSGKLRLSPYLRMRDPLEALAPMLGAGVSYAPGNQEAANGMGRAHDEAQEELGRLRRCTKVLSMTADAAWAAQLPEYDRRFGLGWARARMWEQYADDHRGICLIFAREPFKDLVLGQLHARAQNVRAAAVRYTRTGLAGSLASSIMLTHEEPGSDQARQHLTKHADEYFFLKLTDWESEHEYRFVEPSESEDYSYVEFRSTLVGFIAGHKFPAELERDAIALARKHNVEAHQILWAFNGPLAGKFASA